MGARGRNHGRRRARAAPRPVPFSVGLVCRTGRADGQATVGVAGRRTEGPESTTWPLRADTIRLFRIPRYAPWCGTELTEDWHTRFNAEVVVTGHLHMRATDWRDGVRFEEVSLGYPRHWKSETGASGYLRQILPFDGVAPDGGNAGPDWHR